MTDGILLDRLTVGHSADAPTVRNATAHLRPGTLGCVIGRNGAGKSTLLETLAGLRAPLSGVVTLDGAVPHELPPRRRAERVGYSPQNDTIPRGLTALDYVLLARRPERSFWPFDADDDVAAARRALEACCADPLADRTLGAMSGGELQRVRLALALVGGARFLLLDEPSSHLDPRHRIETFELLRGLTARGITALVVTHDLDLAVGCDVAWLIGVDGTLHAGPPSEILAPEPLEAAFGIPFEWAVVEGRRSIPVPGSMHRGANGRSGAP